MHNQKVAFTNLAMPSRGTRSRGFAHAKPLPPSPRHVIACVALACNQLDEYRCQLQDLGLFRLSTRWGLGVLVASRASAGLLAESLYWRMGANRKPQIEIDRTLKKVAEGIETFDEIWEKVGKANYRLLCPFAFSRQLIPQDQA